METIVTSNYYKVLGEIEKGFEHSREISRRISLSHTQVNKILNYFYNKNILERKNIGKSIIYTIKENFEALQEMCILSKQKVKKLFEKDKKLIPLFEEIFHLEIEALFLFGSYAKNENDFNSDLDLCIVTKNVNSKKEAKKIGEKYGIEVNVKLISKEDLEKKIGEPLTIEILSGIPLLNSELFYKLKWLK